MIKLIRTLRKSQKLLPKKNLPSLDAEFLHEFRTSLATIKAGISGVKDYMDSLVETYQIAAAHHLAIPEIFPQELASLKEALDHCEREAYYVSHYMNMLANNLNEIYITNEEFELLSIKHCLKKAFDTYPPRSKYQKELLDKDFNFCDFSFMGKETLMIQLFFCLIKIAIRWLEINNKGIVEITSKQNNKFNQLIFIVQCKEIFNENFVESFTNCHLNNYFSRHFCDKVMNAIGGNMKYQIFNSNTIEFLLTFKNVDKT